MFLNLIVWAQELVVPGQNFPFFLPLIPPLECKARFIMTRMSSIYQKLGLKPSTPPFHAHIQLGSRSVINLLKASLAHSFFFFFLAFFLLFLRAVKPRAFAHTLTHNTHTF